LIVGANAFQVLLNNLVTADPMFTDGALRFSDRDLSDVEARGAMNRIRQHGGASQKSG